MLKWAFFFLLADAEVFGEGELFLLWVLERVFIGDAAIGRPRNGESGRGLSASSAAMDFFGIGGASSIDGKGESSGAMGMAGSWCFLTPTDVLGSTDGR